MKTLLTLLMPLMMVITFMASNRLFAAEDYYTSALFTIACLCSITLWITVISSKKLALH
jgi:hypothetical protein